MDYDKLKAELKEYAQQMARCMGGLDIDPQRWHTQRTMATQAVAAIEELEAETQKPHFANYAELRRVTDENENLRAELDAAKEDSELLDKLEAFVEKSGDGVAIQFDNTCTNQWMLILLEWQSGPDGWSGGIGLGDNITTCNESLREALAALHTDKERDNG